MNGLIASPAPPPDPEAASVAADGWFPPVTLASVRAAIRLGEGVVTTARLRAAIEGAMLHALRELGDWRAARVAAGAANLAAVSPLQLAGRNMAELLWERIVRYGAAADLVDEHRDITATERGLDLAREKDETGDGYRRQASAAVADLRSLGDGAAEVTRNRVALI